jgi:DNA ligase-1
MEQAWNEAKSKWTDKKEKELYNESLDNNIIIVRPMLAHTFDPNKKISFPLYVQRKYDGIRCIAHLSDSGEVILESRNGIPFQNFDVLTSQIRPLLETWFSENSTIYLDGELYTDEIPFENLSGYIRSKKIGEKEQREINKIYFHIYDFYDVNHSDISYNERLRYLTYLFHTVLPNIIPETPLLREVKTDVVNSMEEIDRFHDQYVEEGFEGIMIRHPDGKYEIDKRSKSLQKYKRFLEEEFTIVGFHQGDVSEKGCVIWDCVTSDGKTFAVRPRGTFEQRKSWFLEGDTMIGKKITVIFQEYSQDGVPRFPVGKAIRENY